MTFQKSYCLRQIVRPFSFLNPLFHTSLKYTDGVMHNLKTTHKYLSYVQFYALVLVSDVLKE